MKHIVGIVVIGALALAGCGGSDKDADAKPAGAKDATSTSSAPADPMRARAQDRAAQSDLRNALTAEKTIYTDTQAYTADAAELKAIEPSLDWGGAVTVAIDDEAQIVCISTTSKSGAVFALADIIIGSQWGQYYGDAPCPAQLTEANVVAMGESW
jgi:hypothetical protein